MRILTLLSLAALPLLAAPVVANSAEIAAVGFSPGNAESVIISTINSAKKSVRMAAYSFTSAPIAEALLKAKNRGVDVAVVIDKSQRSEKYSVLTFLKNQSIPFRVATKYAIMHNKFIVVDNGRTETGSYNFTSNASKKNAENVIVIDDPQVAKTFTTEWQRLWDEAESE